jgi:glyoxylase-like metal-dependent hydrolase (beta-lactamase superfamily II)
LRVQLGAHGLRVADLHAILLTHIHLDHAGATGSLVRENPALRVFVHSRGSRHMINPLKLIQSASRLYGGDLERLFGDFLAVPESNLQILEGNETISFGDRTLRVFYTPGHASHHVTYFDPEERVAFVGDTAGISIEGHPFILPATPPPDIDLPLWDASLDAIAGLQPARLFLTHFGFSDHPSEHVANYRARLHHWADLAENILGTAPDEAAAMNAFAQEASAEAAKHLSADELSHYAFNGALHLSWLGLARYHRKRLEASQAHTAPEGAQ